MLALGVTNAWGAEWEKVTVAPADWSGEYLIVYETGKVIFDGSLTSLDQAKKAKSVTINNNAISLDENYSFTIAKSGSNYTVKSKSGYFIGQTSDANGLKSSTSTSYSHTITINNDGTVNLVSGGAYLRYNAASDQLRFRYYKSSSYSGQKAICLYKKVPQTVAVTGVSLNKTSLTLTEGDSETLTAAITPADATDKTVTWSTSNANFATVSNGKVTAVAEGSATITVKTKDGNKTATCNVTVNPKPKYTVNWYVNGNKEYTQTDVAGATLTYIPNLEGYECGGKVFVGWTTQSSYANATNAPNDLITNTAGMTIPENGEDYYAVFAETGGLSDENEVLLNFTGGTKNDLTNTEGITASGLGSDYAESYAPCRVKFDDTDDYIQYKNESCPFISQVYFKVKMIGGANTSKITIKTSDDGTNYTVRSICEISGNQGAVLNFTENINVSAKYLQLHFTKGSNVGLGPLIIYTKSSSYQNYTTKCAETYTITVANNISNGSVSADKSSAVEGATIKLTATPNTGYKLGTWNIKDASNNPVSVNENGEFTMPASNVTVSATFVSLPKLATPSNLSATEINPTSATLNWKWLENTYDAQLSYYYLYIKKEGDANFTGPITYNSTSCSRTNLEPNTNYIWKVQAISKDKTIVLTSEESTPSYFTTKALPTYTVSFSTGTGNPTQEDIKETEGGAGIKLPAGPDPLCPDWTFAGWAEAEADVTEPTTEPTLFAEGTNYKPADNCTLYAVYSKTEENGGGTDYQLVTSEPTDWSGTYLIVNTEDAKVWKGSATSDNGAIDVTITSNTIKSDETTDKEIFTIAPMTGGYSIKGASGEYISGTSDKNETNYGTSAALNTISIDEDNNVKITSNTSVLRQNNTSKNLFRYYKSSSYSTQHPIQLYKKGTGSSITTFSSNPDCTPPAEYTITWWANGEEFYTQTDVEGTTIEVPASSDVATYACDDKVFVGWVDAEIIGSTNIEPTFITDFDKITGDRDFYAVFATEENNDESIFAVGKSGDFKIYALVEGANIYATAYDNGKLGSTSDENSAVIYTFTHKGENQYTIYNGSKYIAYGTSGTELKTQSDEYLWKIAPATNGKGSWRITSVSTTKRAIIYNTSNYFKAYATSNITTTGYYDIEIGSVPTTTYSGYVTTCEKPTYTRDVTPYEYGTICIPYGSNNYTGAEFYEISWMEMDGTTPKGIWLDEVNGNLTAGKPYIFKATNTVLTVNCTGTAVANPAAGEAGLVGTFKDIKSDNTILEGNYMISGKQFLLCPAGCWLNANRAYIDATIIANHTTKKAEIPGRRRVCLGETSENEATGFENIVAPEGKAVKVIENGQLIIIRNGEKFNVQGQKL